MGGMNDMDMGDLLRDAVARKRAAGGARLGLAPPPGPEPPPNPPPPPPRPAGTIPAGPRGPWWASPASGDFISQLIRRSRRYPYEGPAR